MPPPHASRPRPHDPLPGTVPRPRGLFIDRWGTLLAPPCDQDPPGLASEHFTPRALETLFRASQDGWAIYLIGNEDAVARGAMSDAAWSAFEADLLAFLASYGVRVQRNYACLDDPEHGKGRHRRDSVYMLPNTGAMYHAMQHDGVELGRSWVIGDGVLELVAGWRAGCHLAVVGGRERLAESALSVEPELETPDLAGAIASVLQMDR